MASDLFSVALFSLIDLLRGSFINSLLVFIFVFFAVKVRRSLSRQYKWSWFKSSFITTYLLVFSLILVLYLIPIIEVVRENPEFGGSVPVEFQIPVNELFASAVVQIIRLLVVALVLSFMLVPLEFVGLYIHQQIVKKFKFHWAIKLYLAVFLTTLLSFAFIIFWLT